MKYVLKNLYGIGSVVVLCQVSSNEQWRWPALLFFACTAEIVCAIDLVREKIEAKQK